MCGLCGVITKGKLTDARYRMRQRILDSLLIANEDRGNDSTGVALIGKDVELFKRTKGASDFVNLLEYKEVSKKNTDIVIGHTRLATLGKINEKNSHPFVKGTIIGAHNGIISNHFELDKSVEVDSEAIFSTLNKYNNDFKVALPKIKGSYALAWHDRKTPDNIYLVSHFNPISIALVPALNSLFWSSEYIHLLSVINAAVGTENNSVFEMPEDTVYTINKKFEITETSLDTKTYTSVNYSGNQTPFDARFNSDDPYEEGELYNDDWYNKMFRCNKCGFDFEYDSTVYYDYKQNKVFCNLCAKHMPINELDRMKLQEFKEFSFYE